MPPRWQARFLCIAARARRPPPRRPHETALVAPVALRGAARAPAPRTVHRYHADPQRRPGGSGPGRLSGLTAWRRLWRWAKTGAAAFVGVHVVTTTVATARPSAGVSMLPTVAAEGTWVAIGRLHRRGRWVAVGDVVVFGSPNRPGESALKRVLGLPGDLVLLQPPPSERDVGRLEPEPAGEPRMLRVPEGHCWLAGDNLTGSIDSRIYGPLPMALIEGKVFGQIWFDGIVPKFARIRNTLEPATVV